MYSSLARSSHKILSSVLVLIFSFSSIEMPSRSYAQSLSSPILSAVPAILTPSYEPTLLRGITLYSQKPLSFDFIVTRGENVSDEEDYGRESEQMVRDFMVAMTVPEKDLWVNLSPYEKDRILPDSLNQTEMGKDFLILDYALKQLTASLMSPEGDIGKAFWDQIYETARNNGINDIPQDVFHKVWIAPEKAVVFERGSSVFIADSHLKVMLEEDYEATRLSGAESQAQENGISFADLSLHDEIKQTMRDVILPVIEKEVNEGQTFARLRQMYHAIILAKWYKKHLKQSLLGQIYVDQGKTSGLDRVESQIRQEIYDQYVQAFQQGAYSQIREDYDPGRQEMVTRSYFSGGLVFHDDASLYEATEDVVADFAEMMKGRPADHLRAEFQPVSDSAMLGNGAVSNTVFQGYALDISQTSEDAPFNRFLQNNVHYTYQGKGWPSLEKLRDLWPLLQGETKQFFVALLIPNQNFRESVRQEVGLLNAIAYFRQLHPKDQKKILDDVASKDLEFYEMAHWLKENGNLPFDQMKSAAERFFNLKISDEALEFVRFHDQVLRTARSARIGMEVVTQKETDTQNIQKGLRVLHEHPEVGDVVFGVRSAAVVALDVESVQQLRRVLRGLRIVEGTIVNLVDLGDGKYYIYDEYKLRKMVIEQTLQSVKALKVGETLENLNKWMKQRFSRSWTQEGLEHLIRTDMGLESGTFFDAQNPSEDARSQEARSIAKGIMFNEVDERLMTWDAELEIWRATRKDGKVLSKRIFEIEGSPVETSYQATMDRKHLFYKSMSAEVESQLIFNYRAPIVILDDSGKEIHAQNVRIMKELEEEYGVTFYHMDLQHRNKEYAYYADFLVDTYQKLLDENKLPEFIRQMLFSEKILEEGKISREKMRKRLESTVFKHISGVRNRQFLVAKGEGASLNFDDDAPPYVFAVIEKVLDVIRGKRSAKREYRVQQMLRDVENVLNLSKGTLKTEQDLYALPQEQLMDERVQNFMDKYFAYDASDSHQGLIPEAMGQIRPMKKEAYRRKTIWAKALGYITDQRYYYWMKTAERSLQMASVGVYDAKDVQEDVFPVNYSSQARYLGKSVGQTDLPVMINTLRGLLASNANPQEIAAQQDRIINMMTFDFNRDTDTGGAVQFLNYLLSDSKLRDQLQTTGQVKLLEEGGRGFTGPDNWPVFNRLVMRNLYVFASLMGPLRGEEPLMGILSINPVMRNKLIVAAGKVVGGQKRLLTERLYVISRQDVDEMIGATARSAYLAAVEEFERFVKENPEWEADDKVYERYRYLGEKFIEQEAAFELSEENKAFLKKEQEIRARMMSELGVQIGKKAHELSKAEAKLIRIEKADTWIRELWKVSKEQPKLLSILRTILHVLARNGTQKKIKTLRQEVLDMEMILMQYAADFDLYNAKSRVGDYTKKETPDYGPKNKDVDYLYRVTRKGDQLIFQAVYPDIKFREKNRQYDSEDNQWRDLSGKRFVRNVSDWDASKPLEIQEGTGEFVFIQNLPDDGFDAIVPYINEQQNERFFKHALSEIKRQIKADGETMLIWPDLVKAAMPWKEFSLKRANVNELEFDSEHLRVISQRILDEMNQGVKGQPSSLKMLDTFIQVDDPAKVPSIGLIHGTGMNTSVVDANGRIYNMEAGGFNGLYGFLTPEDQRVIRNFSPAGGQVFEKLVSGKYLGELTREYLTSYHNAGHFLRNQKHVSFLHKIESFSAELMSEIEAESDFDKIIEILKGATAEGKKLGLQDENISQQDALVVKQIVTAVFRRAGHLIASNLAAGVQWMDPDVSRNHVVAAEGSVIEKAPHMMDYVLDGLKEILGPEKASRIRISLEGSIPTGGVQAALIAQNKEFGQAIVVDTGGSNSRVYLAEIKEGRTEADIIPEKDNKIVFNEEHHTMTFREFLRTTIVEQIKRLDLDASQRHAVSWTFAFPVKQTGLKSGEIAVLTKGFVWPDVLAALEDGKEGVDPVKVLEDVLREEELDNIDVVILLNDTPRRQLAIKVDNAEMSGEVDRAELRGGLDMTRFDLDVRSDNAGLTSMVVDVPVELRNVKGFVPVIKSYQPVDISALLRL